LTQDARIIRFRQAEHRNGATRLRTTLKPQTRVRNLSFPEERVCAAQENSFVFDNKSVWLCGPWHGDSDLRGRQRRGD
jgi:hypothetical protein